MVLLLEFNFLLAAPEPGESGLMGAERAEGIDSGSGNESKSSVTSLPPYTVHTHPPTTATTLTQTGFLFPPHTLLLLSQFNLHILGCIVPQIEAHQQHFGQKRFNDLEFDAQIPAKISSGSCFRYSSIALLYV